MTVTPEVSVPVAIEADDSRGGRAVQAFTLTASNAARIQGAVFHDNNRDTVWQEPPSLLAITSTRFRVLQFDTETGTFRYPFFPEARATELTAFTYAPDGTLYATHADSARLLRIPADSKEIQVIAEAGQLRHPSGIAVGEDGIIYVGDEVSNQVIRFDPNTGESLGVFASHSAIRLPRDLHFGPDGDLYVLGAHSRTIHRFDGQTGAFKSRFSVRPSGLGNYMTFGPDGLIYVTGVAENRVRRYEPSTGQLVDTFIPAGYGGLDSPVDLEFGSDGNLYIANSASNQVFIYDGTTGTHLGALETPELSNPRRLAFSPVLVEQPEPGLEGWTVFIDANRNGRLDDSEQSTVTDASGRFVFDNVLPGKNWIVLQGQPGWQRTAPALGTPRVVVEPAEDRYRVDFGVAEGLDPSQPNTPPEISPADTLNAFVNELFLFRPLVDDVDGDPLVFSLPVAPSGMTVHPTLGTVVWQPTNAQLGPHQFVVKVEDGRGGLAIESFTVEVHTPNTAPVITSRPPSLAVVDMPFHYAVYAQDAEQDPIQFGLENEPDGMAIDTQTGLLTWTPTADQLGSHAFSIVASDGRGGRAVQAVSIEVVATAPNDPPVINSQPRLRARVGQVYGYLIEAHDPNGDPLSYHLDVRPPGMTVDATGVVQWQPASELLGTTQPVSIRVEDGRGGVATQQFDLQVVSQDSNQAPIITSTPPLTGIVGRTYQYQSAARDPEGDPMLWSLDTAPAGMSIDPLRGTIRWTPAAEQTGSHRVVVRVQDIFLAGSTQAFDLTVRAVNLPPSIRSTPPVLANPDELYAYAVRAVDPDGDPLMFRLAVKPDRMTIDEAYNVNGRGWVEPLLFSVEGNAKLGNFAFTVTDFAVLLAGIPITISRTYDTLQANREGDFGFGWSMSIAQPNISETVAPGSGQGMFSRAQPFVSEKTRVFLTNPDGKRVGFTFYEELIQAGMFGATYAPRFRPDPGVYDKLEAPGTITRGMFGWFDYNPDEYTLTTKDGLKYHYLQHAGLQTITDTHGNVVTFTSNAITHSNGEQVQLIRDARGRITQIVDTTGETLRYQYDAARNLLGFTNQIDDTTRYVYHDTQPHFLDKIYNPPNVLIFKATFDDNGRLTGAADALGNMVQQQFDPGAFSGTITDARGNVTTIWYDQRGNVTEEQSAPVLNAITGNEVTYTKTYEYTDPRHPDKETKIVEYDGTIVEHQYDAAGNTIKTTWTSKDGTRAVSTGFAYDAKNNLIKLIMPGNVLIMPGNVTSTLGYTGNNVTSVTSALGDVARATYDSQGRRTSFTDFNRHTTTYVHAAGCSSCSVPALVTHPEGSYEVRLSNRLGLVTREEYYEADDTLVYVTTTEYDNLGRKKEETVGTGADKVVTTYVYHGSTENVTRRTVVHPSDQSQDRVTHYFYDAAGNLIRQVDPDLDPSDPQAGIFFKYDASGNQVWLMRGSWGQVLTFNFCWR